MLNRYLHKSLELFLRVLSPKAALSIEIFHHCFRGTLFASTIPTLFVVLKQVQRS